MEPSRSGASSSPFSTYQDQETSDLKRKYVPRATQACHMCRKKKTKCDQGQPCSICQERRYDCIYSEATPKSRKTSNPPQNELRSHRASASTSVPSPNGYNRRNVASPYLSQVNGRPRPPESGARLQERSGRFPGAEGTEQFIIHEGAHEIAATSPADLDPVGDVNRHTSGTEFYGTSSNFALLSQLLFQARFHAYEKRSGQNSTGLTRRSPDIQEQSRFIPSAPQDGRMGDDTIKVLKDNRVSIVNLLFDEDTAIHDSGPPSRMKTPVPIEDQAEEISTIKHTAGFTSSNQLNYSEAGNRFRLSDSRPQLNHDRTKSIRDAADGVMESRLVEKLLEKEYVRIFLSNLHFIHPFLSPMVFTARCEREIWENMDHHRLQKHQLHFFALYNSVIAVGALTAGTDLLADLRVSLGPQSSYRHVNREGVIPSSVDLSKVYFARAKKSLGDCFEVCSLESVQALILMSLYCQNALKPHACYMYSGMAVRTALAIGLPDECMSNSKLASDDDAQRTWWGIYSQEVDMCCSSGRRSSLMEPQEYRIPLPDTKISPRDGTSDAAIDSIAMIPEMVRFAAVLLRTSRKIYHNAHDISLQEKSQIALSLDKELQSWRSNLPPWLSSTGSAPFREPEWAGKQRLVLQLRFFNAKILIHRPLMANSDTLNFPEHEIHTAACLDGARKTIELLYDSYTHRHYFRTWWYNSTYTLYASMVVLYVTLSGNFQVPVEELIHDVEKSLEILHAMENVKVARRCASLIREVLEVVGRHLKAEQQPPPPQINPTMGVSSTSVSANVTTSNGVNWIGSHLTGEHSHDNDSSQPSQTYPGFTRDNLLASIMDSVALEGFASDVDFAQALNMGTLGMAAEDWVDFSSSYPAPMGGFDGSGLTYWDSPEDL